MRALGPVILLDSLTAEQIGVPPAYFNARYLLSAAAAAPIPATTTLGGFTQSFVEQAVADMRWPNDSAEVVRFVSRSPEERDLPRLRFLRLALQSGGMLRKYRGAFHTTVRGRALLAPGREGELYLALCEAFFGFSALGGADEGASPLPRHGLPLLLWLLLQSVGETTTVGDVVAHMRLAGIVPPGAAGAPGPKLTVTTVRQRLLEPLEELGLVEFNPISSRRPARSATQSESETTIRVTALFERFVIPAARLN
jgi:hypothetical protein